MRLHLLILFTFILTSKAATITWSPVQTTQTKADLIEGSVVSALNLGPNTVTVSNSGSSGSLNYTFNAADFTSFPFVGTGADAGESPNASTSGSIYNGTMETTGDADFDQVIGSFSWAASGIVTGDLTLEGLTTNQSYLVQLFFNDQRTTSANRVMTFGDGNGNTVDIGASATPGAQLDDYGQFAIGAFTADSTNQTISVAANGFGNVHFNALLLVSTNVAPPLAPTNLVVTPGAGNLELEWTRALFQGFRHFNILRSETMGTNYTTIASTSATTYFDTAVNTNTTYYYVVTAENLANETSSPSNEAFGTPAPAINRPNFVFIITDDQDTYSVGAYRRSEPAEPNSNGSAYTIDTPHIDRLAAEGMLFHQARIMGSDSGAVCTPSRTSIMTGKNTWERTTDVTAATTFPGVFNSNNYATYRTCKNGNSYATANNEFTVANDATKRGNTNNNGSEWHGDRAVDHIIDWDSNGRQKPFMIYYGFSHPHDTRNARPELLNRYGCVNTTDPSTVVLNPNAPPLPVNALTGGPADYPTHPFDNGHLNVRDEINVSGFQNYRTEAVIRNEIGRNFACVDWIDQQVGRVLARLEDPNGDGDTADSVMDNTYIVFTSDHGIAIGRHGLQGKQNLYEHTWRVPYIVRGPGIAAGSTSDALIHLHDTFPTFADLANIDLPPTIDDNDGKSFRAVLEGSQEAHRDYVYGIYAGGNKPGMRAITDGRWKLIKYDVAANATQVTQLFDLQQNPFELLPEHGVPDLADHPAYSLIRQELEEQLMRARKNFADPYAFLGDRLLLRFEEGTNGVAASTLFDALPWQDDGVAMTGNGGLPVHTNGVFSPTDCVVGHTNTLSLDFEADTQSYVQVPDSRELDFANQPFTIETWVKFESMPTGTNTLSSRPVVMKKVIGAGDDALNYMFLAAAGSYGGNGTTLALLLGSDVIVSTLAVPDTEWHHISVAFDPVSDAVRFTMDDQVDMQSSTVTPTANGGPLVVGAHFNSAGVIDRAFDGLMDELSITSGFLSLSEIQPLKAAKEPLTSPIIAPFKADQLRFSSKETQLYDLQTTDQLVPAQWTTIESFIGGNAGTNSTTIVLPGVDDVSQRALYRLRTSAPQRP